MVTGCGESDQMWVGRPPLSPPNSGGTGGAGGVGGGVGGVLTTDSAMQDASLVHFFILLASGRSHECRVHVLAVPCTLHISFLQASLSRVLLCST